MTVIAWDGKTLAVDKNATLEDSGAISVVKKLSIIDDHTVFAFAGQMSMMNAYLQWYKSGTQVSDYPESEETNNFVIVSDKTGSIVVSIYESSPYYYINDDKQFALGCGQIAARVAMDCGCNAVEAVLAVSKRNAFCGGGVDSFTFEEHNG